MRDFLINFAIGYSTLQYMLASLVMFYLILLIARS